MNPEGTGTLHWCEEPARGLFWAVMADPFVKDETVEVFWYAMHQAIRLRPIIHSL